MDNSRLVFEHLKKLLPDLPERTIDLDLSLRIGEPPKLMVSYYAEPLREIAGELVVERQIRWLEDEDAE